MQIARKLIDKLSLLLRQVQLLVFHLITYLGAIDLGKNCPNDDRKQ